MRSAPPPAPAFDELNSDRLVLRDGSVASVRAATNDDAPSLRSFFHALSPESRRKRFFTAGEVSDSVIERLCESGDLSRSLTLIASRSVAGASRVIAAASYVAITSHTAEVAFAVDDRFQGKGISTLLLEQLAAHASAHGFESFLATTMVENEAMREVFRDSGFEIRSKSTGGLMDVQLSLAPSLEGVAAAERRRHSSVVKSLRPLLAPHGVAVIGASRNPAKIGGRILQAITDAGFHGPVYAVNPAAQDIEGIPVVGSPRDLPANGIELAIVTVPAESVLAAVDDCAAAGIKALVVITAGFAEVGAEGRARQRALVEKVRGYGMRMVGPNCMGLLASDPSVRLNASFSPVFPPAGHVAFSSQSGALGIAILELALERQVGMSTFVSVGNKADVSSNDLLEYWEEDPATRVILLYLESFGNPRRFARVARRIGRTKPIVAVKSGRTRAGSRAAGSHTAALAASDAAVDALFRQCGVIRAETISELFDIAACLDTQPLPRGGRVAIVTNAGGPGILAADACEGAGLIVAELSPSTREALARFLPSTASVQNPVDLIASAPAEAYRQAIAIALAAPEVDALVVIHTPVDAGSSDPIVEAVKSGVAAVRTSDTASKPVLACVMTGSARNQPIHTPAESIPTYPFPEDAVRALGKVFRYSSWRSQPAGLYWAFDDIDVDAARAICQRALRASTSGLRASGAGLRASGAGLQPPVSSLQPPTPSVWLNAQDTYALLQAYGLPVAASTIARSAEEAAAAASVIGFPVVAKISSVQITHKTDVGGVRLNLRNGEEVRRAYVEMIASARRVAPEAVVDSVVIQPMVSGGIETIVGVAHDPTFGPLVGFGIGGVDVELLGDISFRIAPLTDRDTDELLHEIRGVRLLQGYRGRPAADLDALRDILLRISRLADDLPEVVELDLNPVLALEPGKGCRILDARIRVSG